MVDQPIDSKKNDYVVTEDNGNVSIRRSVQHLPNFYRTDSNQRFFSSTLDQLIQPGSLQRVDGYIGRKNAYTRQTTDTYLSATSKDRENYQLEPTVTYTDADTTSINPEDQVKFLGTYDDFINQIKTSGGLTNNHDRLNKEKVYSWNPAIDFDKLINYREYYWLPEGPNPILITSVAKGAISEITVTGNGSSAFRFNNYSTTDNPIVTLYRGNTYKFNVKAQGHPFYIQTEPSVDGYAQDDSTSVRYSSGVTDNGKDKGVVTFVVPTNAPDILYYQCGNHQQMNGVFQIKTATDSTLIDVEKEFLGKKNYTTASGLTLTNGMKLRFGTNVVNSNYASKQFYVEGVGESITLTDSSELITPESYAKETTILYDSVAYDDRPYAISFYRPEDPDYITIKRDSVDRNAWSRYNRWFHRSVIETTATANGTTAELIATSRAKRPIIEFDSGLALYNHATISKKSVALFDTVTTDVGSDVVNSTGYIIDGVNVADGMRVIFTNDSDTLYKNKTFKVNFVTISGTKRINLSEETDVDPLSQQGIYVELGKTNQGKSFYYDDTTKTWTSSQTKTKLNQQPLFGIWDNQHVSFDDTTKYPSSTFSGAKVFAYKISDTATIDTVLGLKVKYNTINNVGDIVFEADLTGGSFTYKSGNEYITKKYGSGHLHYTTGRTTHNSKSNWIEREEESYQRVIRTYTVDDNERKVFAIDAYKNSASLTDLQVSVEVNSKRKTLTTDYTLVNGTTHKFVSFTKNLNVGDVLVLKTRSLAEKISSIGFYEVPENLSVNPLNNELSEFTFGQISNHVSDIYEKNTILDGVFPGVSNLRDHPEVRTLGGTIVQHTGGTVPAIFNLIDKECNFLSAIDFTGNEYEKFKNNFLTYSQGKNYNGDAVSLVDDLIAKLSDSKTNVFPFYYEDMIGHGENVSVRTYTVQDETDVEYALDKQFSLTELSNRAVYIYKNDVQLIHGLDYTFNATEDSVTISATLVAGDIIKIKDYENTIGSYIPPTPTKLGMYKKYKPEIVVDNTYRTTRNVIVGHDGSRTPAFGDYRDDILLELEKRIYNNIKVSYNEELLNDHDIIPSAFYDTGFKISEVDDILGYDFYTWAGKHSIQYRKNNTYLASDKFTYNFSSCKGSVTGQQLPGHWRGIFKLHYDTDRPHTHPWEMLGFSEKPTWWETEYGPAPYTSANIPMWTDIQNGFVKNTSTYKPRYNMIGLLNYLPVDENGNLKDPLQAGLVSNYESRGIQKEWKFGDHGPAENAWRRSSLYPYAVTKLLSLTKPAKFFGVFLDNSRLIKNSAGNYVSIYNELRQKLSNVRYHLETVTNEQTGVVTRYQTAGYQPMTIAWLTHQNLDPAVFYYNKMKNLSVQLAYKLGGFTDKENIKILTDSLSPASTSGSQFVPDENYKILFRTSNPVENKQYSGVIVEYNSAVSRDGSTLEGGYKVFGYDIIKPYFTVYKPIKNNQNITLVVDNARGTVYQKFQETSEKVTYGTTFTSLQDVVDFISGYAEYLRRENFSFENFSRELNEVADWNTSIKEFLYWSTQGWAPGSVISLSPAAFGFTLATDNSVVGKLEDVKGNYTVLDSTGKTINRRQISTKRIGKTFEIKTKGETGLYQISLKTVQKEHILLFDNKTSFNDIIFDLPTGFRQQRLKLVGWKTGNWNGDYYSPGFLFDEAKVSLWSANVDYQIGDNVEYNAKFYVSKVNHNSGNSFDTSYWTLKDSKPRPQLIPNFDYKISQFNDFYNLETNNFDETQQSLAQHLIGYQSRDYLENLLVNDTSQYKFYQGYIREKGTRNVIDKLLKATFNNENTNLDIFDDWMFRVGDFGDIEGNKNIQISLEDNTFTQNPQSIELLDGVVPTKKYLRSAAVTTLYEQPLEYVPSQTFSEYDLTKEGFTVDTISTYKTAGYARLDDVEHTAFSIDDVLNLDVNLLDKNEKIWVANTSSKDWDMLRISETDLKIIEIKTDSETEVLISFNLPHSFSVGDFLLVKESQFLPLNKIYKITKTPSNYQIVIPFDSKEISGISVLEDESTLSTYGNIYKLISVRLQSINNVNDSIPYYEYKAKDTDNDRDGDKVFADNVNGSWKVYEKIDPYRNVLLVSSDATDNQSFGYKVVARNDSKSIVTAAPGFGQGSLTFITRVPESTTYNYVGQYQLSDNDDNTARFGESLSISSDENYVFAGAPYNNTLSQDGSTRFSDSGIVKTFNWQPATQKYVVQQTIKPPTEVASQNFGWATACAESSSATKYLLISAPGFDDDRGRVYTYRWAAGVDGSTLDTWSQTQTIDSPGSNNDRFGHRMAINNNGDILAISAVSPGNAGRVYIYTRQSNTNNDSTVDNFVLRQTLSGVSQDGSSLNLKFGDDIAMSKDGTTLMITAPGYDNGEQDDAGIVYYYKWNADGSTLTYSLQQTIFSPESQTNMKFGSSISINGSGNRVVIGAEKFSNRRYMKFDSSATTFDLQGTEIIDDNVGSGGAFTATMYHDKFVVDHKLISTKTSSNDDFGKGVFITDQCVLVGAPEDDNNITSDGSTIAQNDGTVTLFETKETNVYSWKELRIQPNLIDERKILGAFTFDRSISKIIEYLDYYDPMKGRILGQADREINYKMPFDPARYNYNTTGTNLTNPWAEDHVGEVWWDLSTMKYLWYEQNDLEYKVKNWGKLFPGSSIDIYEWVETTLLPSEWNNERTSQAGLLSGISGIPLNIDNTKFTIKQKYNSITNSFQNYYYYWVKNSVFLPDIESSVVTRKNTTGYISNLISNPFVSGQKYFAITGPNSILVHNVKEYLSNNNIVLNIDYGSTTYDIGKHSVWKIISEGDKDSTIPTALETKWWDSLIGRDTSGREVPDLNLPLNRRYGNSVRPRQSWYIDRFAALKEIIQRANLVLKKYQLSNNISYVNLNSQENIPSAESLVWDQKVSSYADLTYIDTRDYSGTVNVLVENDEQNSNGFWAIYQWNGTEFNRTRVQTYKTSTYYRFIDWYAEGHDENIFIDKKVKFEYELDGLDLPVGSHVKVTSSDTGGWKTYMRTNSDWLNVATENGTIQLQNTLFDYTIDDTGYAGDDTFDENFFDQTPTIETRNILKALRDDIFIGDLKVEYNTLFFTGVQRVLSEQFYVDWLFKSSFISMTNSLRPLSQRKTYTVGTDDYIEKYIDEVKPFHTKIRDYKLAYTATETQDGINTDFDLPPFYDSNLAKIRNVEHDSVVDQDRILTYPYKFWNDNYKKYVNSITVTNGGSGYTTAPTVTLVGGHTNSTGPFKIYGLSTTGTTGGTTGWFYPLYSSRANADLQDKKLGGSGQSEIRNFQKYPGVDFYVPVSDKNDARSTNPLSYNEYSVGSVVQATAKAIVQNGSVTKINVLTKGSGYTSTPSVIITGGAADGSTPSNAAKGYANLKNDLVRDFDTTIKFDRVSRTATVRDWAASTLYYYSELIRYKNELYRVTNAHTSGTTFKKTNNNLQKLRGDEPFITAAERTLGLYNPSAGMPGLELNQLMTGIDYGGVMVTGLLFTEDQGWDKDLWYNSPWDAFGSTNVKTFYGDGSTATYTFSSVVPKSQVYTVYYDGVRQPTEVFRGDGSSTTFTFGSAPANGVKVELIPFDEDKVLTPTDDKILDSLVSGGLFKSALGISPSDVIVEGDAFVTPETSFSPEENIPGSIFDTLDIKVYTAPESGVPFITNKTYIGNGSTTQFSLGKTPGTQASVVVSVNGVTKDLGTDYSLNLNTNTLTFASAPANLSKISIRSFAISGNNYLVFNKFTGDGSTVSFVTTSRESFQLDSSQSQLFVTVDGQPSTAYTTSSSGKLITVTFSSAPSNGSSIQIAGFNQSTALGRAYAEIRSEDITYDGSTSRYTLTYPAGAIGPYSGLTIAELNGKILRGPDNTYYFGDGSTYTYGIAAGLSDGSTVDPVKTITSASDVEVYVNGTKKILNTDYTVDLVNSNVVLVNAPLSSDVIAISTLVDTHYLISGTDIILKTSQIISDGYSLSTNDTLRITTFNNALGMKQRREVLEGRPSNVHELRFYPLNSDYIFVWLNGEELVQNFDYTLNGNVITVAGRTITSSDRLDVMYFAIESAENSTGFRIFKDMLNRSFYKRISQTHTTELKSPLNDSDKQIEVVDGSKLSPVDGSTRLPGVIFIDKERIEYFVKENNTLKQIRRGTLGTGIKAHVPGAKVVDASGVQTVPYADSNYIKTYTGDGSTAVFATQIAPSSASELDIFIGGRRLLLTSEDGSTVNYTVDGSTSYVTLSTAPASGVQIKIIQKQGQIWYNAGSNSASDGKGLQASTTQQARFIAGEPTNAPE